MTSRACPGCGNAPAENTILMEVVEGEGSSDWVLYENFWSRLLLHHRTRVQRIISPPFCNACAAALSLRRTIASLLAVMPLFVCLWGMAPRIRFLPFAFFFGYAYYLTGRGNYTWADSIVYGAGLKEKLRRWIPEKGEEVRMVRFPVPAAYCALRLALFFIGGFITLMLRDLFAR